MKTALIASLVVSFTASIQAQVSLIVPGAPGGRLSELAKIISPADVEHITWNKGDAIEIAHRSGRAILVSNDSFLSHIENKRGDDSIIKRMKLVALLGTGPFAIVGKPEFTPTKLAAFIKGESTERISAGFGGGNLSASYECAQALSAATSKDRLVLVPFKGEAPLLTGLKNSEVDVACVALSEHLDATGLPILALTAKLSSDKSKGVPHWSTLGIKGEVTRFLAVYSSEPQNTSASEVRKNLAKRDVQLGVRQFLGNTMEYVYK